MLSKHEAVSMKQEADCGTWLLFSQLKEYRNYLTSELHHPNAVYSSTMYAATNIMCFLKHLASKELIPTVACGYICVSMHEFVECTSMFSVGRCVCIK